MYASNANDSDNVDDDDNDDCVECGNGKGDRETERPMKVVNGRTAVGGWYMMVLSV